MDGGRFGIAGINFAGSGDPARLDATDDGRLELRDAVDCTRGLEIVTFVTTPWPCCVLLLLFDAVDVRRPTPASDCALLNVVDASLAVDIADVGRVVNVCVGGRRLAGPPLSFLVLGPVGVLARREGLMEGADDLGLMLLVALTIDGVLELAGVPDGGVRGVTFVMSVLERGGGVVFVGVVVPAVLDESSRRCCEGVMDDGLGVSFESGRGPDTKCLFDSCVGVDIFDAPLTLLATEDLTDAAVLTVRLLLSFCAEGVMLRFTVLRLSTLARRDTESASVSGVLLYVVDVPRRVGVVIIDGVWVDGGGLVVLCNDGGGLGDMRSSTGTSISVPNKTNKQMNE
jgi:hypothetical protein